MLRFVCRLVYSMRRQLLTSSIMSRSKNSTGSFLSMTTRFRLFATNLRLVESTGQEERSMDHASTENDCRELFFKTICNLFASQCRESSKPTHFQLWWKVKKIQAKLHKPSRLVYSFAKPFSFKT